MKKPNLGKPTDIPKSFTEEDFSAAYNDPIRSAQAQEESQPMYTGRYFLIMKEGSEGLSSIKNMCESKLGFKVASTLDFTSKAVTESEIEDADVLMYDNLNLALVGAEDEQINILSQSESDEYIMVPEKIAQIPAPVPAATSLSSTWGINVTQVINSQYTGKGVKVAILDTGFDMDHPDFVGRNITAQSFVPGETYQDTNGHGTFCTGTACGNTSNEGLRYGIAKESDIFIGKVLGVNGGAQSWIINGMEWAVKESCSVISMSLGTRVYPGQGYDIAYERTAKYALSQGSLVIAAAGNDSNRSWNQYVPVRSPADCPSVIAVAALDSNLQVANFSNRTINPNGQVDIAGPGVDIFSASPMPKRYAVLSGTSMATPHVSGIAALLKEKLPDASPFQIIYELESIARRLPLLSIDVGVGLTMSP